MIYTIIVRDTTYRQNVEEQTCITEIEAKDWVKQFRKEYPREDGYKVICTNSIN